MLQCNYCNKTKTLQCFSLKYPAVEMSYMHSIDLKRESISSEYRKAVVCFLSISRLLASRIQNQDNKMSSRFKTSTGYRRGDHDFRRCLECATACSQCGTKMGSARSFATATTMCWPCNKKKQMVKCDACDRNKESHHFDAMILWHHVHHNRKVVCLQCVERGYSPLDVRSYLCQGQLRPQSL